MEQEMEKRIWEYIDGIGDAEEKAAVARLIREQALWRRSYEELISVHQMLAQEELDAPSMRFTKNVMEEIAQYQVAPATRLYINKNIIRGIMAFFLIMITGFFVYFIAQLQWTGGSSSQFVPKYNIDAGKLNLGKMFNFSYISLFIGINVILGFILLDRYMEGKRNAHGNSVSEKDSA